MLDHALEFANPAAATVLPSVVPLLLEACSDPSPSVSLVGTTDFFIYFLHCRNMKTSNLTPRLYTIPRSQQFVPMPNWRHKGASWEKRGKAQVVGTRPPRTVLPPDLGCDDASSFKADVLGDLWCFPFASSAAAVTYSCCFLLICCASNASSVQIWVAAVVEA